MVKAYYKAKQTNLKAKIATISVVSVRYYKYAVDLQKVYWKRCKCL